MPTSVTHVLNVFSVLAHCCSIAQKKEGRFEHIIQIHLEVLQLGNCMISGHVQAFKTETRWQRMTRCPCFRWLIPCVSKDGRPKASKADCLDWSRLLKLSLTVPATYSYKPKNIGWQVDSYIKSNKSIVHDIWTSLMLWQVNLCSLDESLCKAIKLKARQRGDVHILESTNWCRLYWRSLHGHFRPFPQGSQL